MNDEVHGKWCPSAARILGIEIRARRIAEGISQQQLTRDVGLSSHSNLSDYERGMRVPPHDLILEFERALRTEPGALEYFYRQALTERSQTWKNCALSDPEVD